MKRNRGIETFVILAVLLTFSVLLRLAGWGEDDEQLLAIVVVLLFALSVVFVYFRGASAESLVTGLVGAVIGWVVTGSIAAGVALGMISFIVALLLCRMAREIGNPFYGL
ncbi:MAG: hypothetical protein AABY65_10185 [Nitrospirota bacterium]